VEITSSALSVREVHCPYCGYEMPIDERSENPIGMFDEISVRMCKNCENGFGIIVDPEAGFLWIRIQL